MDDRTIKPDDDLAERLGLGAAPVPRRRRWMAFGAGALGLALLLGYCALRPPALRYVTEPVMRGPLTVTVSATGTLKPLNQVDVGAEISGRIVALDADFNDRVTKGEVIAEIDTAELKAKVVQSQANVANAAATVVETRAKRDRVASLRKSGTSSKEDLDIAQAAFDRAAAALDQAQALLDVDRTTLSRAQIRSPIDGIVLDRKVEVGQTVASAFQTPVLFTLAEDLKHMRLHVDIDEADVGRVRAGEAAFFTVDAYAARRFAARVEAFRNAPHTNDGVVTYEAVLSVDNPDLALRPGMTANADIVAAELKDALLVPNGALRFTPPGYALIRRDTGAPPRVEAKKLKRGEGAPPLLDLGAGYGVVWTLDGRRPVPHVLQIGASDGIESAVTAGDVTPGMALLVDVERKDAPGPGP